MPAREGPGVRAVFLDKDGTLIEDVPYNVRPERMQLTPGAAAGLRTMHQAGYCLIVVSNQSGVARGYFEEEALGPVERRLREMLADSEVPLAGFYYCPHHPQGQVPEYAVACACRKPQPGLLLRAAAEHGIDVGNSWMVGDRLDDVEAGLRAGCRTVLLPSGHETERVRSRWRWPDYTAADLAVTARIIAKVPCPL
jgi:D,D-heptose 1,7-bisphosphate phosphatase